MTGRTISHYRILEKLGEGGMGPSLMLLESRRGRNSSPKRPLHPVIWVPRLDRGSKPTFWGAIDSKSKTIQ